LTGTGGLVYGRGLMREIVLATRNRRKLEEVSRILRGLAVRLLSLEEFPGVPEVQEDQESFRGNALKKARAVARATARDALADDSGLEVYALGGAPGVRSARYAGQGASDRDNNAKLLRELAETLEEERGARFLCVLALASPDGRARTFEGSVEGRIARAPAGESGFGYDPLFIPRGERRTFAQMGPAEKDAMSHRGRALALLREHLEEKT
jgi:XTP/dITP diphosphohydrolase